MKQKNIKIVHEAEKCIGCGACVSVCEKFWQMKDNKSHLKGSKQSGKNWVLEISEREIGCNEEAAEICPVDCIKIKK
ncbi:MAG: ferredoxin [Candidatus Woesearchaeota archaeon]